MEQPLPQCLSTNRVPRAFFPRVAIGCRLSLKIDRNLSPFWAGGLSVATWYDTAWIEGTASGEYLYRSVGHTDILFAPTLRKPSSQATYDTVILNRKYTQCTLFANVTLTLIRWPWYTNLTWSVQSCTCIRKWTFRIKAFRS